MSFFNYRSFNTRGFSLIELVVTITIVTLITAIIMVRYSSFDSSILLNNQAYELALDIRETQVRAISIQVGPVAGDPFASNFGLYFNSTQPNQYILFQDRELFGNVGRYDAPQETIGDPLTIDSRFRIATMYINGNPANTVSDVSVLFKRPNFDARISGPSFSNTESVHIVIESVRNSAARKTVVIYRSGQISVE
jgi:prepilin-type N-terminal cleavage/methylation domain-containing protein